MDKAYDHEEDFFKNERKEIRKNRRIAQKTDRSKYKKTNQNKTQDSNIPEDALLGRVLSISGAGIIVSIKNQKYHCSLKGSLKKDRSREKNIVVVGDFVYFRAIDSYFGQIIRIQKRFSILERMDISGKKRQLLASNIDIVFVTSSVVLPPLKPFLIDRYVIAAKKGGMQPIILINKIDLLDSCPEETKILEEFIQAYADLTIICVSCKTGQGIFEIKELMQKNTAVFSGQSGVGKSSLINEVLGLNLPVGAIVYKGRHTTTKAELIPFGEKGFCIDTPGIRSFGVWEITKQDILNRFTQIQEQAAFCKFDDCSHTKEPDCAVKKAVASGSLPKILYQSYCKLLEEANHPIFYS